MARIISVESVDCFVGNGMISAAEDNSERIDHAFRNVFSDLGDKTDALQYFIDEGIPLAYLISTISHSLKNGLKDNTAINYVCAKRCKSDILFAFDYAQQIGEIFPEVKDIRLKDIADYLMLGLGIFQPFLERFKQHHDLERLEEKTREYYQQLSDDLVKVGFDNFAYTIRRLSYEFGKYLSIMRQFSEEHLGQN